jgi:hypothetical protein
MMDSASASDISLAPARRVATITQKHRRVHIIHQAIIFREKEWRERGGGGTRTYICCRARACVCVCVCNQGNEDILQIVNQYVCNVKL